MAIVFDKTLLATIIGTRIPIKYNQSRFFGYSRIIDTAEYSVYERQIKADKIVASHGDIIVKQRGDHELIYIPDARIPLIKYHFKLNNKFFPGLKNKSKISQCLLIPYLRIIKQDSYFRDVRLCVITDKGQIFHNKPARNKECDGYSHNNDVAKFEESVVWDIPGRKFPTKNNAPAEYECYYPGLPESCYSYSPIANCDYNFVDKYNNGGFGEYKTILENGEKKVCSRFYIYSATERSNPFFFIGTGDKNDKMCLIGTYRANVDCGTRICLFASSDGGREWFCKYEFSDIGEYSFQQGYSEKWGTNFGNSISIGLNVDCSSFNMCVYKRVIELPDVSDGNIISEFKWELMSDVLSINSRDTTVVSTERPHGLSTGNIIAFKSTEKLPLEISWMNCKTMNNKGTDGGIQFKVRVIDDNQFEIYELLSSQIPTLPCRHIHHINTMKDGWIVGTGEIYPNGWLLYVQQKMADTYSIVSASDKLKIWRLNTKESSVQRTMGLILNDDKENRIIFASDHDTLERKGLNWTADKDMSRGSTGIFVGKLNDIDDRNQFECVYDAFEPCYYFQQVQDMLVFAGQRGELAICFDPNYKKWKKERLNRFIMHYMGYYRNYHIFNEYIIYRR